MLFALFLAHRCGSVAVDADTVERSVCLLGEELSHLLSRNLSLKAERGGGR